MNLKRSLIVFLWCGILKVSAESAAKDIMITSAERSIDIASQLVKINTKLTLSNEGQSTLKVFHYTVEEEAFGKVSYIGASVSSFSKTKSWSVLQTLICYFTKMHAKEVHIVSDWTNWRKNLFTCHSGNIGEQC